MRERSSSSMSLGRESKGSVATTLVKAIVMMTTIKRATILNAYALPNGASCLHPLVIPHHLALASHYRNSAAKIALVAISVLIGPRSRAIPSSIS
jgi:hypothetical protein